MLENPTPFEEWMFQNAEGVETYPKDKMLEKAFNDGMKIGEDKISKHILELQKTNGSLTDRVDEAREIIKVMFPIFKTYFFNQPIENYKSNIDYIDVLKRTEQFIKE